MTWRMRGWYLPLFESSFRGLDVAGSICPWPSYRGPVTVRSLSSHRLVCPGVADHSWVVAAEFDWSFLLVAGHVELTDWVLADPGLEAHQVLMTAPVEDWTSDTTQTAVLATPVSRLNLRL